MDSPNSLLVDVFIFDHQLVLFCLTETWLQDASVNESTLQNLKSQTSDWVLRTDKVITVGDLNSVDNNYQHCIYFTGFTQIVNKATHSFNHYLDSVLEYGVEIDHLIVFPSTHMLSDHFNITGLT